MAESKNNPITQGLSGKFGNMIVFRSKGGRTFVSAAPRKSSIAPSEAQKEQQQRFQEATVYAKIATVDPETKEHYEAEARKRNLSSYNVAVGDFLNAPNIVDINLEAYSGNVGDTIVIVVTDDFGVEKVAVDIQNADGTPVEAGDATPDASARRWTYTAQAANPSTVGDKITVRAYDRPGNETEAEQEL